MTQVMAWKCKIQDKAGSWFIAYLDMDESRQFRVFNSLGFEFIKAAAMVKGAIYLNQVRQRV